MMTPKGKCTIFCRRVIYLEKNIWDPKWSLVAHQKTEKQLIHERNNGYLT